MPHIHQMPVGSPALAAPIQMRTLVLLRWVAIFGQLTAVIVAVALGFQFHVLHALLLIAASSGMNLWLYLQGPRRATSKNVITQLLFDVVQIAALLCMTGGIDNPFALLMLAPVTIAATALNARWTIMLGLATVALITFTAFFAVPLRFADGTTHHFSSLYELGHWAALIIGVFFFSAYAHRVTTELSTSANALVAIQTALSREQRLQHLGGVVAAAAHEMGTPLATIKLITSELKDELQDRPDLSDDLTSLQDSVIRCTRILQGMGRAGKDDLLVHTAPLQTVLEDAAEPHMSRSKQIWIEATNISIRRDPEVIHALRNLIQNAVDFSDEQVEITGRVTDSHLTVKISDDGPGFPPGYIARIGDPYLTTKRPSPGRQGYEGMGLGLFIAKTLLERSGAELTFINGDVGAIVLVRWPLDRLSVNDRIALGDNPPHES